MVVNKQIVFLKLQALAVQKRKVEEEKNNQSSLKRENQTLSESCQDIENKRQKLAQELQSKENQISCLDGKLSHTKAQLDTETAKVSFATFA